MEKPPFLATGFTQSLSCPYFSNLEARYSSFFSKNCSPKDYDYLLEQGFRRLGFYFYKPQCTGCQKCVPLRVEVKKFQPSRSQKKILKKNNGIQVAVIQKPKIKAGYFQIYQNYLKERYGQKEHLSLESFELHMLHNPSFCQIFEYRKEEKLVGLSWLDRTEKGLSAVYFAYDQAFKKNSLGIFSLLYELDWAKKNNIPFYYLGFWVRGAPHMDYKKTLKPHQILEDQCWREEG